MLIIQSFIGVSRLSTDHVLVRLQLFCRKRSSYNKCPYTSALEMSHSFKFLGSCDILNWKKIRTASKSVPVALLSFQILNHSCNIKAMKGRGE